MKEPLGEPDDATRMLLTEYQEFVVDKLAANYQNYQEEKLIICSLGLAGESGEFVDRVKKAVFHGLGVEYACADEGRQELGDILYYLTLACHATGTTLLEVLLGNVAKLKERYPNGFDPAVAHKRAVEGIWGEEAKGGGYT
jgi:NTP pyrophosphatase (non-canonical NTP hydrolase)